MNDPNDTNEPSPGNSYHGERRFNGPRTAYTKAHAFNKLMSLAEIISIPDSPVYIEYAERGRWVLCLDRNKENDPLIHYRSKGAVFNSDGTPNLASFAEDDFPPGPESNQQLPQDYLDDTRFRFLDALKEFGGEWSKIAHIMIGALRETDNHESPRGMDKPVRRSRYRQGGNY